MSLADELLADLEGNDHDEDELEDEPMDTREEIEEKEEKPDIKQLQMEIDTTQIQSVRELCKLRDSDKLKSVMQQINNYGTTIRKATEIIGPVEADPEYQLIVEANDLAADIDNEVVTVHKFVRDKYQKRFPELESLVVSPLEYVKTVKELGNDLDQAKNNETLQTFLTQATIMVVSVTASTTQGTMLSKFEKEQIDEACNMAIDLNNFKLNIYEYVESRMAFIAPNITIILGASIAAKLMGVAGGLTRLSKIPACNVLLLGQQKKTLSGFSQATMLPHTGFVYYCDIVQNTPPDLRRKAARLVATKCTLAARVDACHESSDGRIGRMLRDEIERKLDKLQEPPPVKFIKPLPKPIDQSKKKRGGKRVRKMKERYALTEFRKHANRMNFAEIEDDAYQEDLGYTRGTIGKTGTGRIRLPQVDEKTKVRISKTLQKNMQKQQIWGGSTTVKKQISGTASSVAFTPLQGLEIVNPQAAETNVSEANAKYFSNTSGFLKLDKK
ncbi:U4/U6 small nuclear ribonucleoprotein Prp31 [Anthonomus grandis grandis]|uniref:U4/U6 small nuclear ribonucleoprotein Prp31 n=1 Tax=Anthonomus grandis grandis TaxID=2921223 RepID=UPI0021658C87|nr:U4/U6 small nuclear ribonucleoprotein Prp31 [Anthonomus grandis grandis]